VPIIIDETRRNGTLGTGNAMTAPLLLLAAALSAAGPVTRPALFRAGSDPAPGLLVNVSPGARPFDPPDPSRPSVVFVHGFNPVPRLVHFRMAEELAAALARRGGPPRNVLSWDWNAVTYVSASLRTNFDNAVDQGERLSSALRARGLAPASTHLIGQSAGSMVAASAARCLLRDQGQAVAQLTLLDPAAHYHHVVFGRLAAGTASPRVENYWAPGPSGFGREVGCAGVRNFRIEGRTAYLGAIYPPRSSHWDVVHWYFATVEDRACPVGFNATDSTGLQVSGS